MKTTLYFTLILLTFVTLTFVPNSFAQADSPEYVMRAIYFYPNDLQPYPNIDTILDYMIKDFQKHFADRMEFHGFGRKTFRFEANGSGDVIVHQVKGNFNDAHYSGQIYSKVLQEFYSRFGESKNIDFFVVDTRNPIGSDPSGGYDPSRNHPCGIGGGSSDSGLAVVPAYGRCFGGERVYGTTDHDVYALINGFGVHELLHAFGMTHDRTESVSIQLDLTSCAAEWLDRHHYFNLDQDKVVNHNTTIQMLPPTLVSPPATVRFRFEITDPDGLHLAHLIKSGDPIIACQKLSGTSTTVEFVTTKLFGVNFISLKVMDAHGNFVAHSFPIDITNLLPSPTAISIPDPILKNAIHSSLNLAPDETITELNILNLSRLNLLGKDVKDLTGLEYASSLQELRFESTSISDIAPIAQLKNLGTLEIWGRQIQDITPIAELKNLYDLGIIGTQIQDITPLKTLTNLRVLSFAFNKKNIDITLLTSLKNLEELSFNQNPISDINPIWELTQLRRLMIRFIGIEILDISPLKKFTRLEDLQLDNHQISDISPLTGLTNLRYLLLQGNQITDVSPLAELVNLWGLYLAGNPIQDFSPLRTLLANNPKLTVDIDIPDPSPLAFSPSTIAGQTFTVGEAVNLTLPVATGGTPPYAYTLTPLPGGLSFNATERELSGTLTTEGTTTATYTATDAASVAASLTFTIRVTDPPPAPITFNPSTVADQTFTVDTPITPVALPLATGGTAPYTYTLSPIPAGLQFDSTTRKLSGTPTTPGTTDTTYTATDTSQQTASLTFTITVRDKPTFDPSVIADQTFTVGEAVNLTLPVATGGTPPYTYTLTPLPGGLSFNATERVLSGTPTTEGTTTATYTATDAASVAASLTFTIRVTDPPPAPITFNPSTVADQTFTVDTPITPLTLPVAKGGTSPYTYSLSPIPSGIRFNLATRLLSGTPTVASTTEVKYTATDAQKKTASLTFRITVIVPLTFAPDTVADQEYPVDTPITPLTLPVAKGGIAPYTYTFSPIPDGLSFDAAEHTLSGTPTTVGTTTTTYTATDAASVSTSLTFTIEVIAGVILDVNGDGLVNVLDLAIVALFYGTQVPVDISLPADVNADGVVDILDLTAVAQGVDAAGGVNGLAPQEAEAALLAAVELAAALEVVAGAPVSFGATRRGVLSDGIAAKNIAAALADVRQMRVDDVRLGKGVAVLEGILQLLAEVIAIPESTALLPNYPNPFNPETWIPYQLAKDADVTLHIYAVNGMLVRRLTLGHQAAGMYQNRSRAAYWDGRNELGEPVASGVYFYRLTAGDFTATRKMLIQK